MDVKYKTLKHLNVLVPLLLQLSKSVGKDEIVHLKLFSFHSKNFKTYCFKMKFFKKVHNCLEIHSLYYTKAFKFICI